ncbi:kinetochore protein Nuf2-A-like [Orbicella faveolata]|uniref:kinetochore protein Nuf2-A-like n=1 Tax=Orbicella faveolata TaxID=48498 RepID=UPI0009E49054|nr:kinetochore protein Nuf2-A-like [Orbicella faveolata]
MASEHNKFRFPSLTSEEAVANCKSMFGSQVALSIDDLMRPQFQQMKRFYIGVLSNFGVCPELLTQPQFKSMDAFEHPELHEDSAPLIILALAMQRFMFACGIENFSIFDIVAPKPKRTLHCISAIVNFTKFKASREHIYENAIAEVDTATEQRQQLIARNKELQQKILELRAKRAEEEQQVQKLDSEVQELQNSVSELNKQQATEVKNFQQLKTYNAELSSKKAEVKVNLAALKQDCESLKAKIVQSPERFKGELARLTSAVQSVREARDERNARLQEICAQQDSSLQYTEDGQTALKMITGIGLDMDKLREETAKLEELQDKNVSQKEVLRDMTAKIEQLRRQQASKQEKLSRLMRQYDKRVAATHDATDQLKREQMHLEKKLAEKENYLEGLDNQITNLSRMVKEEEDFHEQDMEKLRTAYQQMLAQLENYHQGLNRGWDKVMTANNR